jgi:replicative DNA helicase
MLAEAEVETEAEASAAPAYEFDAEFQDKITALLLRDTGFAQRTDGLIKPDYMENEVNQAVVAIALDYYKTYKKAPDLKMGLMLISDAIKAKKIRKDLIEEIKSRFQELRTADISDREYVIEHVADFAKNQAMQDALIQSIHLLDKKDFGKINEMIQKAQLVGAAEDGDDYDYAVEIERRTQRRKDLLAGTITRDGITSGHVELDKYLLPHMGWGRKELSVIMGAAKAGKSMSLGEFAKSASLAGHKVLYVTLEVSRDIIADRIDANVSETAMRVLGDSPFEVERKVKAAYARTGGSLRLREFASGTFKSSQLRRMIENYRARGIVFDLIVVDYADIMCPERYTGDQKEDMRAIYLDLRAIAFENNCAVLTATQTNREGAKKAVAGMTDVAEDFNKIRTADIVISINAIEEEVKSGEARLHFAAARNTESGFTLRIKQDRSSMRFLTKVLGKE